MAETLRSASAVAPTLGVTRVTDITRLDVLGVPVYAAVRPRGRTLRVHAGKGMRVEDARVGAFMEAIEFAVAERVGAGPDVRTVMVTELVAQFGGALQWLDFAPALGSAVTADQRVPAVPCEDLLSGQTNWVPAELVSVPQAESSPLFGWSTSGLASGNSLDEATLHAALELLERDTVAMHMARDESRYVETDTLPPPFAAWARDWRRRGIELHVRYLPNVFEMPCFEATLHEPGSVDVDLAGGSGLHPDRGIALTRAICEAAQSRLTVIHGGRDDTDGFFTKLAGRASRTLQRAHTARVAAVVDKRATITYSAISHESAADASPTRLLDRLLRRLAVSGFDSLLRRPLICNDVPLNALGLHVVKVVIPRCETLHGSQTRLGPRLLARILSHV